MMWMGTGTISQEEVKAAINSLMVTNEVKAALRQMQNASWKPYKYLYHTNSGAQVNHAMAKESREAKEKFEIVKK